MRIENDLIHEAAARQLNMDEYNELFIILSNTPKNSLLDCISPTDLVKILSFMDFENEEISDLAERLAKLIFPLFPIDFVQQSSEMLVTIFTDENYHLTLLIFNELTNVVKLFKNQGDVIVFTDEVMKRIVDIIFSQYLELSWTAQGLLIHYCEQSPDICFDIFKKVMKPKFKHLLSSSVNVFRYIDVGIEIVLKSKHSELFELAIDDDVIAMINAIINSEDLLAHMNVLDVLKKVAVNDVGYRLVNNKNILDNLYKRLPEIVECPFSAILLPGYLSLFGQLCRLYPQDTVCRYGNFLNILMDNFENDTIAMRLQALDIFANFASAPQSKLCLAKQYENIAMKALSSLVRLLSASDPDCQSRAANALALILSARTDSLSLPDISSINQHWCTSANIAESLIGFIGRAIALPIEVMKVAALNLSVAISSQSWGQKLICNKLDLIDFLLIRSDHWKSCIDLKFELIDNLVVGINQCSGTAVRICSENVAAKLLQYHSEGKYFAVFQHDMMVDTDV